MIFPQMTIFDHENVLKSLENGPKLMIITVQNRQHYAEKVYHFYLVRVETPPHNLVSGSENSSKTGRFHVFQLKIKFF